MKQILAFGDSNTWGLIPGSKPQERYPWGVRWTSLLQKKCEGIRVIEEGLCGRTTAFEDDLRPGRKGVSALPGILESQSPLDAAIIMLGTNDCKKIYGIAPYTIGQGMELCLDELEKYLPAEKILLVSPLHLGEEVWRPEKDPEFDPESVRTGRQLKEVYEKIAARRGNHFLAASDYVTANSADDEHMDENGHREFAEVIHKKLKEMGVI